MNEVRPISDLPLSDQGDSRIATGFRDESNGPGAARASIRDPLIDLFYHIRLLRNLLLVGFLAGVAAAVLAHPSFIADSLLLVLVGPESTSAQDITAVTQAAVSIEGLKVVQSEMQIVRTDQVLRSAVETVGATSIYPDLGKPRWLGLWPPLDPDSQVGEAVQRLRTDLQVESDAGSNIIRLAFSNTNRDVAIRVVQAVEDAYLSERKTLYSTSNLRFLSAELDRYKVLLSSTDQQIQDVKKRYQVLDLPQDIVLAANRLDGIVQRQYQVRERRVAVEAELVAVKTNLAKQPATVLDFKETTNNTGNDEARNTLVRLEQERTRLRSLYGPSWPGIVEIDKQIASVRAQMGPVGQNLYFSDRQIRNPAIEVLSNRLASLEVEDQALAQQLVELADQYNQSDARIKDLREAEAQLHRLQLSRDVTESIYRQLAQRQPTLVFQDNQIDAHNANLRVVQAPTAPVVGQSMAISYLLGGIFLGLLTGFAATVIATLLRQVYIRPDEVERDLGVPALAVLDETVDKSSLDRQPGVSYFGAILQDVTIDGRGLTSLQIMGISDGDDRVDVVRAFATEIAVGYERKTLILDMEGSGSAYLSALGAVGDARPVMGGTLQVLGTRVPRLSVARDVVHSELADWRTSTLRLRGVLEELQKEFAMLILVGSADILRHATRRVAAVVDANAVIVRAEHSRAPVARQLCEAVRTAGGNVLGFVFVGRKYYVPSWLYRSI